MNQTLAAAPSASASSPGARVTRVALAIALLHGLNDACTAFLNPLLPRIMAKLGLSIALAATLAMTLSLAASLLQPFMGWLADRHGRRVFVVLGPVMSGVFLSLIGVAPTFGVLIVLLALGGLGSAAFHPPGASFATRAEERRGSGARFSVFSFGGAAGYAVGPLAAVALVSAFGLPGLALAMVPILVLAVPLWRVLPEGRAHAHAEPPPGPRAVLRLLAGPLGLLFGISAIATFVQRTFLTLQPISVAAAGGSEALGALTLSIYLAGQAAGTLMGGALADRFDRRRLLATMSALAVPAHILAIGLPAGSAGALIAAAVSGMLYMGMLPSIVVMAQELMPGGTAIGSGVVMGLAWALGAVGMLGAGALADAVGARSAALLVVPAFFLATVLALRTTRA